MFKILAITLLVAILLCFIYFINKPSEVETIALQNERISLLNHCDGKFQYKNTYYAICPYGKNIKLNYSEFVALLVDVQIASEEFIENEEASISKIWLGLSLIVAMAFVTVIVLSRLFFYDDF